MEGHSLVLSKHHVGFLCFLLPPGRFTRPGSGSMRSANPFQHEKRWSVIWGNPSAGVLWPSQANKSMARGSDPDSLLIVDSSMRKRGDGRQF